MEKKKLRHRLLSYIVRDRRKPVKNRERVGQNLMILSVIIFFVFIINFVIIIGTDTKFGVDLSAEASQVYQQTVKVQAKRGAIYDRDGIAIAETSTNYSIYAIISNTYEDANGNKLYVQESQYDTVADILNQQLGIDKETVLKQLKQTGLFQVSFGKEGTGISYSTKTAIEDAMKAAKIEGIGFTSSLGRMYPNGIFASQFIGTTTVQEDANGSTLVGNSGLEASLNDILSGSDGQVVYQKDKNGNILLGTGKTEKKAVDGQDVYTTLSEPLQSYLETQMDIFQAQAQGKFASATVVNAKTGEILATSQRPTYNPQTMEGYNEDNLKTYNAMLYQGYYEPGSTMKVMTLASAIDDNIFNPNEYYDRSGLQVSDAYVQDWDVNEGITSGGYMTFAQGFAHSSNVAMTILEQRMGNEKWLNYLTKFRFGYPTRFGLSNEDGGIFPSSNTVATAMSSFGQGIGVTQVQMLRAFTAISNDGVMLEPQFISKLYDPNTKTDRVNQTEVIGNPVSATAASQTRDYMVTVGTDAVNGTLVLNGSPVIQVGNESVAVKSGTAQIADGKNGYLEGSSSDKLLYSVVAMVPSEDPDFIMYVTLQQPSSFSMSFWQSVVNPVLERATLMKDTLLAAPKSDTGTSTTYKMPNIIGESPGSTAEELRRHLVHPVILGTGSKISKISTSVNTNLASGTQVLLLSNKLDTIPDMYGWTKENVKKFASWTGIKVTYKGSKSGTVIKQSVDVGTDLKSTKKITITIGE